MSGPALADPRHVVVVGAGQAGVQAAESLRSLGYDGRVTVLGAEPHGPYHRPPLSKDWLSGGLTAEQLVLRAPAALARKGIELRAPVTVTGLDLPGRRVLLSDGEQLGFSGLVLATGARPRPLPVAGGDARGVLVLRTRDDADVVVAGLDRCAERGQPLVVVGGGFIGLEVAAAARRRQIAVTVVEALPRLMARAVGATVSDWFAELHRRHGVEVLLGTTVSEVSVADGPSGGTATGVVLADGRRVPAGAVLAGVGAFADDALARQAGLACDHGVVVDLAGRTAAEGVVAAGDCTATRLPDGSVRRLESVQNAVEQGRAAAATLLGRDRPFTAAPWFWSQQYDMKLQLAGLGADADTEVVRGDPATGSFSVFRYHGRRLAAVDSVNAPLDHLSARKLLDAAGSPDPAAAGPPHRA